MLPLLSPALFLPKLKVPFELYDAQKQCLYREESGVGTYILRDKRGNNILWANTSGDWCKNTYLPDSRDSLLPVLSFNSSGTWIENIYQGNTLYAIRDSGGIKLANGKIIDSKPQLMRDFELPNLAQFKGGLISRRFMLTVPLVLYDNKGRPVYWEREDKSWDCWIYHSDGRIVTSIQTGSNGVVRKNHHDAIGRLTRVDYSYPLYDISQLKS